MKHRYFSFLALLAILAMLCFPLARVPVSAAAVPEPEAATPPTPSYEVTASLTQAQQAKIYQPHEVAIDPSRNLWIVSNEDQGGISIYQIGTNALIANVAIEDAQLPIVLPTNSALTPDGQDAFTRDVVYATSTAPRYAQGVDIDRTNGLVYLALARSGYRWNADRTDFQVAASAAEESGMLVAFDITNPSLPQIVTGYLLGRGMHEVAVNENSGNVYVSNSESAPGVTTPTWIDAFALPAAPEAPESPAPSPHPPEEVATDYNFIDTGTGNATLGIEVYEIVHTENETTHGAVDLIYAVTTLGEKMFVFDGAALPAANTVTPNPVLQPSVSGADILLAVINLRLPFDTQVPEAAQIWASITTDPGQAAPVLHFHDVTVDQVNNRAYVTLQSINRADAAPGDGQEFAEPALYQGRWVAEIDYATLQVTYIDLSAAIVGAHFVAVDPARNAILVTGDQSGNLAVANQATRTLEETVAIGQASVAGVQIDGRDGSAYVADRGTDAANQSVSILKPYFDLAASGNAGGTLAGGGHYTPGVVATVTATPGSGKLFAGWTVDGADAGWANPLTITMANDHTVVANFVTTASFSDVGPGDAGYDAIIQLASRGIILGYGNGDFGRLDTALRAQMAALIVRSMSWDGESWTNDFTDRNGLQAELWQAIGTLQHYGVASGYGDGTFGPNDLVTRAQTIAFITRAMVTQGYWQDQLGAPMPYTGVPAAHVTDLATFYHYTQALGGIPEAPVGSDAWNAPATRGWFAQALWRALDSQFGVDQIP